MKPENHLKIEGELLKFIDNNFKKDEPFCPLATLSTLIGDLSWKNWPRFDERLHYRMLDVSAWKVVFNRKFNKSIC